MYLSLALTGWGVLFLVTRQNLYRGAFRDTDNDMGIAGQYVNKSLNAADSRAERWLHADKSVRATLETCR